MRSCLVAIAKYEKDYIKEWVSYHFDIGFDHIIIGDNNDDNTENLQAILIDYIKKDKVTIIDIKNYGIKQTDFYKHVYTNLVGNFDWVFFCDIDEFLYITNYQEVNDYLSQEKFNCFDIIKLCWKIMSNNGYVIQIDKPVLKRFIKEGNNYRIAEIDDYPMFANNTVKSFYRTNLNCIPKVHCTEEYIAGLRFCDNTGKEISNKEHFPNWSQFNEHINHDEAYVKHFITKSLEEYVKYKMKRGWSCYKTTEEREYVLQHYMNLKNFEEVNGYSKLYEDMYNELVKKYALQ